MLALLEAIDAQEFGDMASRTLAQHIQIKEASNKQFVNGNQRFQGVPRFVYGTAFKGEQSAVLVEQAIRQGFVGIDTAAVSSTYQERLVGDGVRAVLADRKLKREHLYVRRSLVNSVSHFRFKQSFLPSRLERTQRYIHLISMQTLQVRYMRPWNTLSRASISAWPTWTIS